MQLVALTLELEWWCIVSFRSGPRAKIASALVGCAFQKTLLFTGGDAYWFPPLTPSKSLSLESLARNCITHQSHRKSFNAPEMKAIVNSPCTTPCSVYMMTPI